jgi:hypothetical protein
LTVIETEAKKKIEGKQEHCHVIQVGEASLNKNKEVITWRDKDSKNTQKTNKGKKLLWRL